MFHLAFAQQYTLPKCFEARILLFIPLVFRFSLHLQCRPCVSIKIAFSCEMQESPKWIMTMEERDPVDISNTLGISPASKCTPLSGNGKCSLISHICKHLYDRMRPASAPSSLIFWELPSLTFPLPYCTWDIFSHNTTRVGPTLTCAPLLDSQPQTLLFFSWMSPFPTLDTLMHHFLQAPSFTPHAVLAISLQ